MKSNKHHKKPKIWLGASALLCPLPAFLQISPQGKENTVFFLRHMAIFTVSLLLLITSFISTIIEPGNNLAFYCIILSVVLPASIMVLHPAFGRKFELADKKHLLKAWAALLTIEFIGLFNLIQMDSASDRYQFFMFVGNQPMVVFTGVLVGISTLVYLIGINTKKITPVKILALFGVYLIFEDVLSGFTQILGFAGNVSINEWVMVISIEVLAALLTIDYMRCQGFADAMTKFMSHSVPKMLNYAVIIFCLTDASWLLNNFLADWYHKQAKIPSIREITLSSLKNPFIKGSKINRKIKSLTTYALLANDTVLLNKLSNLSEKHSNEKGFSQAVETKEVLAESKLWKEGLELYKKSKLELQKPHNNHWSVFISTLKQQIPTLNIEKVLSDFKSDLPKATDGKLPKVDSPWLLNFVASATKTHCIYLPPSLEEIEKSLKHSFHPFALLPFQGNDHWVSVIGISDNLALLRVPIMDRKMMNRIWESDEINEKKELFYSQQYLLVKKSRLEHLIQLQSEPLAIFSKNPEDINNLSSRESQEEIIKMLVAEHDFSKNIYHNMKTLSPSLPFLKKKQAGLILGSMLTPKYPNTSDFFAKSMLTTDSSLKSVEKNEILEFLSKNQLSSKDSVKIISLMLHKYRKRDPEIIDILLNLSGKLETILPLSTDNILAKLANALYMDGKHDLSLILYKELWQRNPFHRENEMWYLINLAKLNKPYPSPKTKTFDKKDGLKLYLDTLNAINTNDKDKAKNLLTSTLKKDSHHSMAIHLLNKYFQVEMDSQKFFPTPRGL
jgi:tetratricopeptide (TPR) repeat protein